MTTTFHPQSEDELAEIVRDAYARKRKCEIVGRGTKRSFGRPCDADCVLDLSALSGIVNYEADELVITVRAATSIAEIEPVLAAKSQKLGFDPADWGTLFGTGTGAATIGGIVSADSCGSARVRYGAARDHLLGFRAVNGWGEIYKAGSHVVKNVTGFDLPKLVCGAMGTLGPMSELTLRLVPRAAHDATMIARDIDCETGFAALRAVWASPLEPTGLAYVPGPIAPAFLTLGDIGRGAALMRVEGAVLTLSDKIAALKRLLAGRELTQIAESDAVFARLGNGAAFDGRSTDVWRVFVPPADAAHCATALASRFWYADWAGGALWLENGDDRDVHDIAARFGGYAILMRADTETRRTVSIFPLQDRVHAGLTARVKAAFDPERVFNPGRLYEGL